MHRQAPKPPSFSILTQLRPGRNPPRPQSRGVSTQPGPLICPSWPHRWTSRSPENGRSVCNLAVTMSARKLARLSSTSLYSDGEEPSVPIQPIERKLAAIFAADIAGYSRLMARDEVGTLARLKACRVIIDELIASHRGRIFNTAGDSVVADFASAVDAVQCAVAVQAAIATEN